MSLLLGYCSDMVADGVLADGWGGGGGGGGMRCDFHSAISINKGGVSLVNVDPHISGSIDC